MVADFSLLKLGETLIVGKVIIKASKQEDLLARSSLYTKSQKLNLNIFMG
tara:strand:+ start:667 stop:816 length:150 start_codon:yes stop_codon:yes gene_type:complete